MSHTVIIRSEAPKPGVDRRKKIFIIDANYSGADIRGAYESATSTDNMLSPSNLVGDTSKHVQHEIACHIIEILAKSSLYNKNDCIKKVIAITDARYTKCFKHACSDLLINFSEIERKVPTFEDLVEIYLIVAKTKLQDLMWQPCNTDDIFLNTGTLK